MSLNAEDNALVDSLRNKYQGMMEDPQVRDWRHLKCTLTYRVECCGANTTYVGSILGVLQFLPILLKLSPFGRSQGCFFGDARNIQHRALPTIVLPAISLSIARQAL